MKNRLYMVYIHSISIIGIFMLLIASACMKDHGSHDQTNVGQENNPFGNTPLHVAVQNSDLVTVNQLCLDPAVNVNKSDKYGVSPLHFAAEIGDLQIVKALLSHQDLNVNKKNAFGKTALDIASQSGHEDVVELLRKFGGIGSNRINK